MKKVSAPQHPKKEVKLKKQEWASRVRIITPVLIRKGFTREGKASSVHQIRNYLKKEKKLTGAELKQLLKIMLWKSGWNMLPYLC